MFVELKSRSERGPEANAGASDKRMRGRAVRTDLPRTHGPRTSPSRASSPLAVSRLILVAPPRSIDEHAQHHLPLRLLVLDEHDDDGDPPVGAGHARAEPADLGVERDVDALNEGVSERQCCMCVCG